MNEMKKSSDLAMAFYNVHKSPSQIDIMDLSDKNGQLNLTGKILSTGPGYNPFWEQSYEEQVAPVDLYEDPNFLFFCAGPGNIDGALGQERAQFALLLNRPENRSYISDSSYKKDVDTGRFNPPIMWGGFDKMDRRYFITERTPEYDALAETNPEGLATIGQFNLINPQNVAQAIKDGLLEDYPVQGRVTGYRGYTTLNEKTIIREIQNGNIDVIDGHPDIVFQKPGVMRLLARDSSMFSSRTAEAPNIAQ